MGKSKKTKLKIDPQLTAALNQQNALSQKQAQVGDNQLALFGSVGEPLLEQLAFGLGSPGWRGPDGLADTSRRDGLSRYGRLGARTQYPKVAPVTLQNITSSPMYAASKAGIETNYQNAINQALEMTPGDRYSGLLSSNLNDLAANRAATMSGVMGDIGLSETARRQAMADAQFNADVARQQQNMNLAGMALGLGPSAASGLYSGAANTGASAVSTLGSLQNTLAQTQALENSAKKGGLGEIIGTLGGSYLKGPFGAGGGASPMAFSNPAALWP
jgi:hypothetical protein